MKKIISLLLSIAFFASTLGAWELGKYGDFKFERMGTSNVWIMHGPAMEPNRENRGFMNNPAFIEGKSGLIVIDPGGNYRVGKKILEEIEKVSKKPIVAVLNTHKHGDHWFANVAVAEKYPKAAFYAHPNMIKEAKAGEADKWYGILQRLSGNLEGSRPYRYPGHGPSGAKEETVGPFLRYLKTLKKWAQKAYDNEEEYYVYKDQVTRELGSIAHWDAYDHQMGKHLSKVYMEIEEKDME